jgi:hypothetical protein
MISSMEQAGVFDASPISSGSSLARQFTTTPVRIMASDDR